MIAYNKSELDNTLLVTAAKKLSQSGFIHFDQYKKLSDEIPTLKKQDNLLIRLCLFLLGCVIYACTCGLLAVLGAICTYYFNNFCAIYDGYFCHNHKIVFFTYTMIGFVIMEFVLVKKSKFFGYGLDDATLLGAQLALAIVFLEDMIPEDRFLIAIIAALVSALSYLRYLHIPSLAVACVSSTFALFLFSESKPLQPLLLMLFSGLLYFVFQKRLNNLKQAYYAKGIVFLKGFCLLLFYFSGNYLVVRNVSFDYLDDSVKNFEIPFSLFFWLFTFIIPFGYLAFGLQKREKILLWIGFFTLGFSFYSFRQYYHLLPPEIAATLVGLLLFVIVFFAIQKLKNKESGITFLPDRFSTDNSLLNLEVLATASQFGMKPEIETNSPMDFGGGGFSGGGADGSF